MLVAGSIALITDAQAQTALTASDAASLSSAIDTVNAGGGSGAPYTINVTANITLSTPLSPIFNSVTINGNGLHHQTPTIRHAHLHGRRRSPPWRTAATGAGSIIAERPQVAGINDLTLMNSLAQGGSGSSGGDGGGMGAGGTLLVNQSADVTLTNVSFGRTTRVAAVMVRARATAAVGVSAALGSKNSGGASRWRRHLRRGRRGDDGGSGGGIFGSGGLGRAAKAAAATAVTGR